MLANYYFRRWMQQMQDGSMHLDADAVPLRVVEESELELDSDDTQPAVGFFAELRRRNVVRVGIAYVVVAWLLLQVGEIVLDFLEVPSWAGKLLLVFLVLGLPIALILAWAFELTPEGLQREKDIDRSRTTTHQD